MNKTKQEPANTDSPGNCR